MNVLAMSSGLIPLFTLFFSLHPIHVSVTEIEFDEKDRALEIMMRVFIDDLELTLRDAFDQPGLDVLNPGRDTDLDHLIGRYLNQHFRVTLDDKGQKTNYLGHERDGEAFVLYIEVSGVNKWKTIAIRNEVIMGTYDDQSNIVHVYVDDRVKSIRLTRNKPSDKLTFE